MPNPETDDKPDNQYLGDLKRRLSDSGAGPRSGRWAAIKDKLAIVAVILVLALLVFMMLDGAIVNFRCTFAEFITFECNRWGGEEHPSLRQ